MRKTILTCDRCKKEVDALNDVGAGLRQINYSFASSASVISGQYRADWCRDCCIEVGFIRPNTCGKEEVKVVDPLPTLEDLIREIIREEIDSK